MEANLKPAIDTGKVLNAKHIITTIVVVIVVAFVISKIFKSQMEIRDANGNVTGTGSLAFKPAWKN